jgi:hypothetical protein
MLWLLQMLWPVHQVGVEPMPLGDETSSCTITPVGKENNDTAEKISKESNK